MDNEQWITKQQQHHQQWLKSHAHRLINNFEEEEYCIPPADSDGSICLD